MKPFVISMRGKPLMPCSERKARILLKEGKAKIFQRNPFTIQLLYPTGETVQNVSLGVDTGAKHIGIAVTSEDKVLNKTQIDLRDDVSSKIKTRSIYRRSRRNRKTRYRKARFLNRTASKKKGWLPPSIQNRINHTCRWTDRFMAVLPDAELHIEVGKFDIQKILNPDIKGEEYQKGEAYGFWNDRYYVFARDEYTCQFCKKKKDKNGSAVLHTHHCIHRSEGGSNRPQNLITVHATCHEQFHQALDSKEEWALRLDRKLKKQVKQFKEPPFMHAMRKAVYKRYPKAHITYGSITQADRKKLNLPKSHCNDAIAISGIRQIKAIPDEYTKIIQIRKKKRSLHEATARKGRKEKNTLSKRNSKNTKQIKNWCLGDIVLCCGKKGYISGFTGKSSCRVTDQNGLFIKTPGKSYSQVSFTKLKLIKRNNNWVTFTANEAI